MCFFVIFFGEMAEKNKNNKKKRFLNGLYPTIAISDFFNCIGHFFAVLISFKRQNYYFFFGYFLVTVTAFIGTLRFGFNEELFGQTNSFLADLSAFIGLPSIGLYFFQLIPYISKLSGYQYYFITFFVIIERMTLRSFLLKYREILKIIINIIFYILPVLIVSYQNKKWFSLIGILLFIIAGLVIKPERHQYLFGIRRENIFHYMLGVSAYLIADGIS